MHLDGMAKRDVEALVRRCVDALWLSVLSSSLCGFVGAHGILSLR